MSNRRKPRNRKLIAERALNKVSVPARDQVVIKDVPAIIHWSQLEGNDRTDDEVIGKALIYDDGTQDVIVFSDISEDAKVLVYGISGTIDNISMEG